MVEEDYHIQSNRDLPLSARVTKMVPHTLGQFIGLLDERGKEIYEGDIVEVRVRRYALREAYVETNVYRVEYDERGCLFYLRRDRDELLFHEKVNYRLERLEVLGNIYDNPELMEEDNETDQRR